MPPTYPHRSEAEQPQVESTLIKSVRLIEGLVAGFGTGAFPLVGFPIGFVALSEMDIANSTSFEKGVIAGVPLGWLAQVYIVCALAS